MIVVVIVVVTGAGGIGSGFGIEWRVDRFDMTAEAFDHVPNDVVGTDPNSIAKQLHRQMTIAEMPGDADKFPVVMIVNLQQRLGPRADLDDPAFLKSESVAIAQPHRLRKVDQQLLTRLRRQNDATAMAAIEIDQHLIYRVRPGTGRQNGCRAHQ
jgi:hypothetical protein